MYLRVINSFEEWLIANNHGNRLDFAERVKLEKELRILFSHPSVARADLNPMEVTERRRMARAALQFPNGRLQFGRDGVAVVVTHAGVGAMGPIFWHNEVNQPVDLKKLQRHIDGAELVDCSKLLRLLHGIIGEVQTECLLHILARSLANQEDASKTLIIHFGTGRSHDKSFVALLLKHLGFAPGVCCAVRKNLMAAFTKKTRDKSLISQALKDCGAQILVLDEVCSRGDEDHNKENEPIVLNTLKGWQDTNTQELYLAGKRTSIAVDNHRLVIITGNTSSPADAFDRRLSPGDALRIFPLFFGNAVPGLDHDPVIKKAALELVDACRTDQASLCLQVMAQVVNYATVPIAENSHRWPRMPQAPEALIAVGDPGVSAWCEANAWRFTLGAGEGLTRPVVWEVMAARGGPTRPRTANGPARNTYIKALNAFVLGRFGVAPQKGRSVVDFYPGVSIDKRLDPELPDSDME